MPTDRPPEGMWFEHRPDLRRRPFLARWRLTDGSKTSKSFADEETRAKFVIQWAKQRKEFGRRARFVDARTVMTWEEFALLTDNVHPLVVAKEWAELRGTSGGLEVPDAWKLFNDDQEKRKLSGDTHSHRRLHGARLVAFLKRKTVASVQSEALDQ